MRIGIMGAGSIGCFLGGRLAAAGLDTVLVGRALLQDEVARSGLHLTDCDGYDARVAPGEVQVVTDASGLEGADVVLFTVKSQDTEAACRNMAPHLGERTVVVSFQNGVRNVAALRQALPRHRVLVGMVPYNVLRKPEATFHRGTSGILVIERTTDGAEEPLLAALHEAELAVERVNDVEGVQWGKLLFNINNSVNALSGLPLRQQLAERPFRRIMAAVMAEALAVLKTAGIKPVNAVKVPVGVVPFVLRLPDALFFRLASTMLQIDPEARSSMWEDLDRRRSTEIDHLNGEVVRLAAEHGAEAPLNARIIELIRQAEAAGQGSPRLTAATLEESLGII